MPNQSLFVQALGFSAIALGAIGVLTWWLYRSPLTAPVRAASPMSPSLARRMALLIGLGALLTGIGGYWDASEHVVTGIVPGGDDFLWPPHLMIYGGFLIAFVVALGGLIALAVPNLRRGVRDPRQWVRRNPGVGAVVLAAGYGLFSVPGDAIWHELYGIDLTAWSPPHIFIAVAMASTPLFACGILLGARDRNPAARHWRHLLVLFYLVLALSVLVLIAVLEWELGRVGGFVARRPIWLYPVLSGAVPFFFLVLARRLVPGPWTATTTALLYFAWRLGVSALTASISGAPPRLSLVFVLGALLLDLVEQRRHRWSWPGAVVAAGAFTLGYGAVALPTIEIFLLPYLGRFAPADHLLTVLVTFGLCALLYPLAERTGLWLSTPPAERDVDPVGSLPAGAVATGD